MDATTLAGLIATCAPMVHPTTVHALIRVESAGNPYAVSINRPASHARAGTVLPTFRQPRSIAEAQRLAQILHAEGFTTSVGIAQINTEHLRRFGLQLAELLDPCTSLKLAQAILLECHATAPTTPDTYLPAILSCFNSGNPTTGIRNGYTTRVHGAALKHSPQRTTR